MLISILPNDIQRYIWKLVYDDMLKDLKSHTLYIESDINTLNTEQQERVICYQYFRLYDKGWGLLTFVGASAVSNAYQIDARPKILTGGRTPFYLKFS